MGAINQNMYEALTETRIGPFGIFRKVVSLGRLDTDEAYTFRRKMKARVDEVVEVKVNGAEALDITAPRMPVRVTILRDHAKLRPTVIADLDLDNPSIRSARPMIIVSSHEKGSTRLAFVKEEMVQYVVGLSDKVLDSAQMLALYLDKLRQGGKVYADRFMDEVFYANEPRS